MTGKGIVTGYDGSRGSDRALRWALWEAEARRAALTVCLAWAPHYLAVLGEDPVYDLAQQRAEEILEEGLRYAESVLGSSRVSPLLARGSAAEILCEQSRTADMVVVGSRGHGGVLGLQLGSVAWELACRGSGTVVITRGQWVHPNQNPGPVVVGADGSHASQAAVQFAFREAALRDIPVLAVCALADAPAVLGGARQMEADFGEAMTTLEKQDPAVMVLRQVAAGSPREALLTAAKDAQLLVVGTRGRGGMDAMNLGSIAQAMLQYAPCPVAVIRPFTAEPAVPARSATTSSLPRAE